MCLGIPGRVLEVRDQNGLRFASVQFAGITREVCLECLPSASIGDYVLVHVGFAISKIDAAQAETAYRALEDLGMAQEVAVVSGPIAAPSPLDGPPAAAGQGESPPRADGADPEVAP